MEKKSSIAERYFEKPTRLKTWSGIPVKEVYTPEDVKDMDYDKDIGNPGDYPYIRGIFPNMYRGRLWSVRELCSYASPRATNERLKYLIDEGESAVNVIGDMPTMIGIDSDHPLSEGEVGVEGVPITSLKDMETMTHGLNLQDISFTWSCYITPVFATYVAAYEKQGRDLLKMRGTFLNDSLVHYLTRFYPQQLPLDCGTRMVTDSILWCAEHAPHYYATSIGPEGIRESGATAAQEIAVDFCIARQQIINYLERGGKVEDVGAKISFTHRVGIDIFEEAAKFRAARRVWAEMLKEFGATTRKALSYKVHAFCKGSDLTRQQHENNIIRIAYQALAAVLGGVQSIHTTSFDEPVCLPTEESVRIAVRTQQILCYETGVVNTADPLGGSYYVEWLTNKLQEEITKLMDQWKDDIAERVVDGRILRTIIDEGAYRFQKEVETGERVVVGVNKFTMPEEVERKEMVHVIDEQEVNEHLNNVKELKKTRDTKTVVNALEHLRKVAERREENIFPALVEAAKAYASLGEMMGVVRMAYGHDYDGFGLLQYPFQGLSGKAG